MTTSASRRASAARTAASCPGRNARCPKTAARSRAGSDDAEATPWTLVSRPDAPGPNLREVRSGGHADHRARGAAHEPVAGRPHHERGQVASAVRAHDEHGRALGGILEHLDRDALDRRAGDL